jgi:hypothetical protein
MSARKGGGGGRGEGGGEGEGMSASARTQLASVWTLGCVRADGFLPVQTVKSVRR